MGRPCATREPRWTPRSPAPPGEANRFVVSSVVRITLKRASTKGTAMDSRSKETPERDVTLEMLRRLDDGSISGLSQFHLLKMQLEAIRRLPEYRPGSTA